MAKISLAGAVAGALLESQQNPNYGAGLDSHYSSVQHCTVSVRNVSIPHSLMPFSRTQYRVIHKSLRDFRTRLRNNKDRHGRKEHINR